MTNREWLSHSRERVRRYREEWRALTAPHLADPRRRSEAVAAANAQLGDPVSVIHPLLREAFDRLSALQRSAADWESLLSFALELCSTSREQDLLLRHLDERFRAGVLTYDECSEIWSRTPLAEWTDFPGFTGLRLQELEQRLEEALAAQAEDHDKG